MLCHTYLNPGRKHRVVMHLEQNKLLKMSHLINQQVRVISLIWSYDY